jgi:GT2 family glycosyltransferase
MTSGIPSPLPSVAFVIPVRDDAERLRVCLKSIARNDYPSHLVRVVVIDNGSTDGSGQVARDAGALVVAQPQGGAAQLRNAGAAAAAGQILAFVDADHEISDQWIRAAALDFSSNGDVAAVGALCDPPATANWVQRTYDRLRMKSDGRRDVDWLGSGNLAIRRAVFDEVGGFDLELQSCEDVDLCNRVKAAGYRVLSDSALRNVHFGDPSTLAALFRGELWRGRDNLKVTLRGPRTVRHFRSLLVPIVDVLAIVLAILAALAGRTSIAWLPLAIVPALALTRTAMMLRRDDWRAPVQLARCAAVALVYDLARALALLVRTSHRTRRLREPSSHVTANSHS